MALNVVYEGATAKHGTGTVDTDSTAGQFLKVVGDDEFSPATDADAPVAGVLYEDCAAGELCTVLKGGVIEFPKSCVGGGAAAEDEIQVNASTGFPTKKAANTARGLIIATNGDKFVVEMY